VPDYKFCVSLHISHPEINTKTISKELNLTPHKTHDIGEPRITPKGKRLNGNYENTFWSLDLCDGKRLDAEEILFEDFISVQNNKLKRYRGFFEKLRKSGGTVDYFIGWFSVDRINMNIYLEPSVLKSTAELNISLVLCAYPSYHET